MHETTRVRLWQAALAAVFLGGWEAGVRLGWIDPFFFPLPSDIFARIGEWLLTADFYNQVSITLSEAMLSFVFGTLLGVVFGLWLGLVDFAARVSEVFIKVMNAVPRVILAPIFALWFGLGMLSKVALGMTLVFFIAFFNTFQGVREVNPVVLDNARLLGAGPGKLLRHVYIPSASSWILSSLRVSIGFAMVGAVVGEYLGSAAGMGHMIAAAEGVFDATGVFAGITVLSMFVLLVDAVVNQIELRVLVWRPTRARAD
jgi:NitT/TauT family transport system permease protein